ncbi:MAG: sigma-70 family RNA polymerase sigma factor [Bacteroidota bacterium]|nr:sigma-70 family RNA polymerase sigma factor [Bacteroidota bacterium]
MDDLTLWTSFRSGDEKALVSIFDRFNGPMFNYGWKLIGDRALVQDSIQDLFVEIWQNRERLGDTDSIKFYLFKSLRRKLIRLKGGSNKRIFARISSDYNTEVSPSPEFLMISEQRSLEKKQKVLNMLSTLTRRQQEAMFLRYFDELNCDQIAMVMDLKKSAVYNLIHNAVEKLRRATRM